MLVASPQNTPRWANYSNNGHHMSDSSPSFGGNVTSKRKRTSCGFESDSQSEDPWMNNAAQESEARLSDVARGKRSRVAGLPISRQHMPTSPANIPFSSDFRNQMLQNRPPTIEEQQSWASSSSRPSASPPAGAFATASPGWVKVQTDYGHAFVREEEPELQPLSSPTPMSKMDTHSVAMMDQDFDASMNEEGLAMPVPNAFDRSMGPFSKQSHTPAHQVIPERGSLWRNIEGDTEMDTFDPDTSRRGDSFAWEDDILQLKVPGTTPHPHPYSPAAEPCRSELGAGYFDQCARRAAQF